MNGNFIAAIVWLICRSYGVEEYAGTVWDQVKHNPPGGDLLSEVRAAIWVVTGKDPEERS